MEQTQGINEPKVCKLQKRRSVFSLIQESTIEFFVIAFIAGCISYISNYVFGINQLMFYHFVGFCCSIQTTYYKWKIAMDPSYVSSCNCAQSFTEEKMASVLKVLNHEKGSMLFNIPNSIFGILFYGGLMFLRFYFPEFAIVSALVAIATVVSCMGSMYLWKVMVFEIRSICILCMTIHATNFLSLLYLFN